MPTSSRTRESDRNLRGAALAARFVVSSVWPHPPSENRRAALPSALGTPDKTAHVGIAARTKHRASDRRYLGKSPALL